MNVEKNVSRLIIILCLVLSFLSCKKSAAHIKYITVPNDRIIGQAIIGESLRSVDYSPKGKFIKVIYPDSGLWKRIKIKGSNKILSSKLFFDDNDLIRSNIYDDLHYGEYQISYVSSFNDTIDEKLSFYDNIELMLPKKLSKFYSEVSIDDLYINNLKQNDTLQLLYQNYGCFGNSETLTEFIYTDHKIIQRLYEKSNNNWIYVANKHIKQNLISFVSKAKKLNKRNVDLCSSDEMYIFRKKNTNKISIINDKSCELIEDIEHILYPKQSN